jgi:hypothetical protein
VSPRSDNAGVVRIGLDMMIAYFSRGEEIEDQEMEGNKLGVSNIVSDTIHVVPTWFKSERFGPSFNDYTDAE